MVQINSSRKTAGQGREGKEGKGRRSEGGVRADSRPLGCIERFQKAPALSRKSPRILPSVFRHARKSLLSPASTYFRACTLYHGVVLRIQDVHRSTYQQPISFFLLKNGGSQIAIAAHRVCRPHAGSSTWNTGSLSFFRNRATSAAPMENVTSKYYPVVMAAAACIFQSSKHLTVGHWASTPSPT